MTDLSAATKEDYTNLTLEAMAERNAARLNALEHQGVVIQDLSIVLIETMLATLLGDRLDEALTAYQRKIGSKLDSVESQVLKMRLGIK